MKKHILTVSIFAALLLGSTVVAAEEYPATDFQPTVVFADTNAASSSTDSSSTKEESKQESASAEAKSADKKGSDNTMLFGIIALAVAGGFFLNSNKGKAKTDESVSSSSSSSYVSQNDGLTGVERYLQSNAGSDTTGVEKYLARKEAVDKEASLTGVDKYLRNRG